MRLAISNIAWRPVESRAIYDVLQRRRVRGLEIAAAQTFWSEPDPFSPSAAAVTRFKRELSDFELTVVSMQSLLFGVDGARLFGTPEQRAQFVRGINRAIALADIVGIPNLVMGSPTNRAIPDDMSRSTADAIAMDVFHALGESCAKVGTRLALEPNPAAYGTNFLNTIGEAVDFAERVAHPNVTVNFDIGSLKMNSEINELDAWFSRARHVTSHVHISEPNLAPVSDSPLVLETLGRAVVELDYQGWSSIEMRATGDKSLLNVEQAVAACWRRFEIAEQGQSA